MLPDIHDNHRGDNHQVAGGIAQIDIRAKAKSKAAVYNSVSGLTNYPNKRGASQITPIPSSPLA